MNENDRLTKRTLANLEGVHQDLVKLVVECELPYPIEVVEGVREPARQVQYVEAGASETLNSRHLTGHAFDFAVFPNGVDGMVSWDFPLYQECADAFKAKARELGIPITWGGDWGIRDGMHIQLAWDAYPIQSYRKVKTVKNSTTIAAAGGVGAVAIVEAVLPLFSDMEGNYANWGAMGILLLLAAYICKERILKMNREGV